MPSTLENSSGVLSHDLYYGPTEQQLEMVARLNELQSQYAELIAANPLFKAAVHSWVEHEDNGTEAYGALLAFKDELDSEVADMSKQEAEENPDRDLHKMVKLRLEIAEVKIALESSSRVTSVDLDPYIAA